MGRATEVEETVELLQQLGLKEYEARCFVGLTQLDNGTAKSLSEITEVPRTRVYDAIRVLEANGLVEVQHENPQQYRAVELEEATRTLATQYEDRIDRLKDLLTSLERLDHQESETPVQEVWSMAGSTAIEQRAIQLIESATEEIVLVLGEESILTDSLIETLEGVPDEVDLVVGTVSPDAMAAVESAVPAATAFISGLDWLQSPPDNPDETSIGRLLLVDESTILVSTIHGSTGDEQAIFGEGFENGVVVVARRLMANGALRAAGTD